MEQINTSQRLSLTEHKLISHLEVIIFSLYFSLEGVWLVGVGDGFGVCLWGGGLRGVCVYMCVCGRVYVWKCVRLREGYFWELLLPWLHVYQEPNVHLNS